MAASEHILEPGSSGDDSPPKTGGAARAIQSWSLLAAAGLAIFYLATSLYIAAHRLFWYDELFTMTIVRLPHWATIWTALAQGPDTQPPFYYMLVRMSDQLLGHNEVAARFPSALALAAGLLITFDCARRLTDGLHGLIALSLLTCSFLPYFGCEARPYGLYFMLSALALWVWTCTRYNSKWGAFFFGAVLCAAVTMHYYATLCLLPYALWEAMRWKPWQRPSPKLVAGMIGVAVPAAALSPFAYAFARHLSEGSRGKISLQSLMGGHPSFWFLRTIFHEWFPNGLFLLALMVVLIVLLGGENKRTVVEPMQAGEVVGWLFLCIPLTAFVLAKLVTHAFASRYFIGTLPGIAVAFACWMWRHFRDADRVQVGVLVLLLTWGIGQQALSVRNPEPFTKSYQRTRLYMRREDSLLKDGKRFILFPYFAIYLNSSYYSKRPSACVRLEEPEGTVRRIASSLSAFSPMPVWTFDDLKDHAGDTALIEPTAELLDALRRAGFQVVVRYPMPLEVVYLQ